MIYPYLLQNRSGYGRYASYREALNSLRDGQRQEHEEFVKSFWPHAFIYEHGPEWTVLPLDWRDRERLKEEGYKGKIPKVLSLTIFRDARKQPERREEFENEIWRLAAATVIEYQRTDELESLSK